MICSGLSDVLKPVCLLFSSNSAWQPQSLWVTSSTRTWYVVLSDFSIDGGFEWWCSAVMMPPPTLSLSLSLSLSASICLTLRPMRFCVWRCSLCCWSDRLTTAWRSPLPFWKSVDSNWPRSPPEESMVRCSYERWLIIIIALIETMTHHFSWNWNNWHFI